MEKIKIHWVIDPTRDLVGNALGYLTHNRFMHKYSEPYLEYDESSNVALHIVSADWFKPIEGKINVLFTMWEFDTLPQSYIDNCKKADLIIVPCRFCRDLFKKALPEKEVVVCGEGIEPNSFPFFDREKHWKRDDKFRFLWVGAPNPRKGYPLVLEAMKLMENFPNIEMYIKTTVPKLTWGQTFKNIWKYKKEIFQKTNRGIGVRSAIISMLRRLPMPYLSDRLTVMGKHKNIFFDTRKLSIDELYNLYCSAHCFLLPTLGEGWGLTLNEAMATGCPCIATNVTGVQDYFDDTVGYSLKYKMVEQDLINYNVRASGAIPDTKDLVEKMFYVIYNFKEALKKGKRASERIHNKFTWDKQGYRLYEILKGVKDARKA